MSFALPRETYILSFIILWMKKVMVIKTIKQLKDRDSHWFNNYCQSVKKYVVQQQTHARLFFLVWTSS